MSTSRIQPHRIGKPMQLLAAGLVTLIAVDSMFVTVATRVGQVWLSTALIAAAILNVPLFLSCLVILITRFRTELQDDTHYSQYLRRAEQNRTVSLRLAATLDAHDLDVASVQHGRSLQDIPLDVQREVRRLSSSLARSMPPAWQEGQQRPPVPDPNPVLELARALIADHDWDRAARYLDHYVRAVPDDWRAQYARAAAHANSRLGPAADFQALRAYNEAIALAPANTDQSVLARAFAYRAAMFRRLGRLRESEADLDLADALTKRPDVALDILYNRACVYALTGRTELALQCLAKLRGSAQAEAVRGHLHDYFVSLRGNPEFLAFLRDVGAAKPTIVHEPQVDDA